MLDTLREQSSWQDLIEMGCRMAMLPTFAGREEWRSILMAAQFQNHTLSDRRVNEVEVIHEFTQSRKSLIYSKLLKECA